MTDRVFHLLQYNNGAARFHLIILCIQVFLIHLNLDQFRKGCIGCEGSPPELSFCQLLPASCMMEGSMEMTVSCSFISSVASASRKYLPQIAQVHYSLLPASVQVATLASTFSGLCFTVKLTGTAKFALPEPVTMMFSLYVPTGSPALGCTVKVGVSPVRESSLSTLSQSPYYSVRHQLRSGRRRPQSAIHLSHRQPAR